MAELNRRGFLTVAGSATAAALMGGCAPAGPRQDEGSVTGDGRAESSHVLDVAWTDAMLDGTRVRLRAYNGTVPGPLLEVRPGERLRILVRNHLTPYDSGAWTGDHNVPHELDTTNLHLHGMDVVPHLFEPVGTSDPLARMIAIGPGESKEYVFDIPADQPEGLYWYHPHHHGSTAVQAVSGLAGGIVVRGPVDDVPEIKAAREIVLVISDIGLFPSEQEHGSWLYEPVQNAVWDTFSGSVKRWDPRTRSMQIAPDLKSGFTTGDYALRYFLANGQPYFKEEHNAASPTMPVGTQLDAPRFTLRPGEVARFRFLNANSDSLMPLVVAGHDVHLIGLDGVNLPEPRRIGAVPVDGTTGQLLLAPANRAEFLIRAGAPGLYPVVQLEQKRQFLVSARKTIAEIEVAGAPMNPPMGLPGRLPAPSREYPLIRDEEIVRIRKVVFSGAFPGVLNPIVGVDFMINNALYDEQSIEAVVETHTAEEWHLSVPGTHQGGTEGHPFHIHVNSFEVISVGGVAQPPGTIMDTVWVPMHEEVVIRMRFKEWEGKSVFHCHILPHEDTGMMQNFLIRRAGRHQGEGRTLG